MKCISVFALVIASLGTPVDGWELFARVRFAPKFFKDLNAYYFVPEIDAAIKSHEGKKITLSGYYIPLELEKQNVFVISRNPYSACFFCGGAGPESVAEVILESGKSHFKVDQLITVTGTLRLNDADMDRLNFIIEHAEVERQ